MELRVLNYFLVIAEEGSLTTASARLHVSQPTLSRQIKELERELGQPLFTRHAHGIRLTEAGQRLREHASNIKDITDQVEREFAVMDSRPMGDVYIGGIDGYLSSNAKLIRRVREEQPGLVFHYHSCSSSEALTMLDHGLLDLAIVSKQVNLDRFVSLPFSRTCRWVAFMRTDNPLAKLRRVTPEDLQDEPLLMYDQVLKTPPDANTLASWFGHELTSLNVVATSNLSSALNSFAVEGAGTLLAWDYLVQRFRPDMAAIPFDPPLADWGCLAWHKKRPLSQAATYVLELIRAHEAM